MNAVNCASKPDRSVVGGYSLTHWVQVFLESYPYILALLRMLDLVFFILKVCLLAALYLLKVHNFFNYSES